MLCIFILVIVSGLYCCENTHCPFHGHHALLKAYFIFSFDCFLFHIYGIFIGALIVHISVTRFSFKFHLIDKSSYHRSIPSHRSLRVNSRQAINHLIQGSKDISMLANNQNDKSMFGTCSTPSPA